MTAVTHLTHLPPEGGAASPDLIAARHRVEGSGEPRRQAPSQSAPCSGPSPRLEFPRCEPATSRTLSQGIADYAKTVKYLLLREWRGDAFGGRVPIFTGIGGKPQVGCGAPLMERRPAVRRLDPWAQIQSQATALEF